MSFYFVQGEEIKEYSQIVKHGEDLDFMLPLNEHEIEGMYFTSWKLNNFSYPEGQNFRVSRVDSDREYTFHPHFEEGYVFNEFILKLLEEEKCETVDGSEVCNVVNEFEITGVGAKYKNLENYIIPEYGLNEIKITRIGNNSFRELDNLRAIELSNNITRIGDGAFMGSSKLKNIYIPKGVLTIGFSAFRDCDALEEIRLGHSSEPANWPTLETNAWNGNVNANIVWGASR